MTCFICEGQNAAVRCPWCGGPVSRKCRFECRHFDEDHTRYSHGFCRPCGAVVPLAVVQLEKGGEGYECSMRHFAWSSYPLVSDTRSPGP